MQRLNSSIHSLPPDHMIEKSKYAKRYFTKDKTHDGRTLYRLKSREQYSYEQKKQEKQTKQYFGSTQLDSLIMDFPRSKKPSSKASIDRGKHFVLFIDFTHSFFYRNIKSTIVFGLFEADPLLWSGSKDDTTGSLTTSFLPTPSSPLCLTSGGIQGTTSMELSPTQWR